jgi:hypothetical protein
MSPSLLGTIRAMVLKSDWTMAIDALPTAVEEPRPGRLGVDRRGSVATIFAAALPVLLGLTGIAVDYTTFTSQLNRLQTAADSAAVAATRELSIGAASESRVTAIAESVVRSQIKETSTATAVDVKAEILPDKSGVRIVLSQKKQALLSVLVTPALTDLSVSATAQMAGARKICVVGLDPHKSGTLELDASARLTGNECAVFSNSKDRKGVSAKDQALISASLICSSGGFEGDSRNYAGQRLTDCPSQGDPIADRPPPPVEPCRSSKKLVIEKDTTLQPGTYCEGIEIKKTAKVTLSEGVYVIKNGQLKVDDTATLYGRNVGFYFTGTNANFDFLSSSTVNLGAPKSGPLAGILFFGDRLADDYREYKITSDNARTLLGTLYIPQGFLTVDSKNPVADNSAYTVIVARRIKLKGAPKLVLNSNYNATDVPVPQGVGPVGGHVRLVE